MSYFYYDFDHLKIQDSVTELRAHEAMKFIKDFFLGYESMKNQKIQALNNSWNFSCVLAVY